MINSSRTNKENSGDRKTSMAGNKQGKTRVYDIAEKGVTESRTITIGSRNTKVQKNERIKIFRFNIEPKEQRID